MSATNRGSKRSPSDFYETPAWCVDRLLDQVWILGDIGPAKWLDPAVGTGAIPRAVNAWHERNARHMPIWRGVELVPKLAGKAALSGVPTLKADFPALIRQHDGRLSALQDEKNLHADVIITNPPYSLAPTFIEVCLALKPRCLALLLRLPFLGCCGARRHLLEGANKPYILVLPERPSFTGDGHTDATEYAWFVWGSCVSPGYDIAASTPVDVRKGQEVLVPRPARKSRGKNAS